jgi:hypothetical protein
MQMLQLQKIIQSDRQNSLTEECLVLFPLWRCHQYLLDTSNNHWENHPLINTEQLSRMV